MPALSDIFRKKSVRYSIPFLLLVVGGSFGLKQFTENRYRFKKSEILSREEAEQLGIKRKPRSEVTLEAEFEKIKQIDIDHWENKRGPRPWEMESTSEKKP